VSPPHAQARSRDTGTPRQPQPSRSIFPVIPRRHHPPPCHPEEAKPTKDPGGGHERFSGIPTHPDPSLRACTPPLRMTGREGRRRSPPPRMTGGAPRRHRLPPVIPRRRSFFLVILSGAFSVSSRGGNRLPPVILRRRSRRRIWAGGTNVSPEDPPTRILRFGLAALHSG
jgi:hypothetical protein